MLQKEKDEREKKEKELEREREDKAEMKRAIKLGLRFIRDERDWSPNSSPKISLKKTESVVAQAGIDLNLSSQEQGCSQPSLKRQRVGESGEQSAAPSSPAKEQSSVVGSEDKKSMHLSDMLGPRDMERL